MNKQIKKEIENLLKEPGMKCEVKQVLVRLFKNVGGDVGTLSGDCKPKEVWSEALQKCIPEVGDQ